MRINKLIIPFMAASLLSVSTLAATPASTQTGQVVALIHALVAGDYSSAESDFNAKMKQALPVSKLKAAWGQITAEAGTYQSTGESRSFKHGDDTVVLVKTLFKNGPLWTQVAFDKSGKIAGLYFKPAS